MIKEGSYVRVSRMFTTMSESSGLIVVVKRGVVGRVLSIFETPCGTGLRTELKDGNIVVLMPSEIEEVDIW